MRAGRLWVPGSLAASAAAALLLGGAVGKSAQLPLQTWLPDAMAGPTPVSALIHAATMVTAGVYLIARMHPLFVLAPDVLLVVALIGAATLLVAGASALVQKDIKRVLAYSTMSQVGYMFLALGVGAWSAAIFHFVTHAFFKALLFLSAGVVIQALDNEHDIFRMGGLRKTSARGLLDVPHRRGVALRPALRHRGVLQQGADPAGGLVIGERRARGSGSRASRAPSSPRSTRSAWCSWRSWDRKGRSGGNPPSP